MVEDEPSVRLLTRSSLQRQGYKVLAATDAVEALRLWDAQGAGVDLLLTDLVMPGGMSGKELARVLHERQPGLKVVFASGYSVEFGGQDIRLKDGENFIQKPYSVDSLLEIVRRNLDGPPGRAEGR
jgi:CheY-like chemotaxis protein